MSDFDTAAKCLLVVGGICLLYYMVINQKKAVREGLDSSNKWGKAGENLTTLSKNLRKALKLPDDKKNIKDFLLTAEKEIDNMILFTTLGTAVQVANNEDPKTFATSVETVQGMETFKEQIISSIEFLDNPDLHSGSKTTSLGDQDGDQDGDEEDQDSGKKHSHFMGHSTKS